MEKTIDTAIVGTTDEILLFNAVGITAFPVKDASEAEKTITKLSQRECKIIYVTEELYETIPETIGKYQFSAFPILIPIPSGKGSKGIGLKRIADNVENAIGIDIF